MTKRCSFDGCNKKIKLTSFPCKCEKIFCDKHRLPEAHKCTYDFKTFGKNLLIKNNPVVIKSKVIKI